MPRPLHPFPLDQSERWTKENEKWVRGSNKGVIKNKIKNEYQ
jgi:hypothetical protein